MNLRTSILVLAHLFLTSFRLMCGHNARIAPLHKTKTCSKKKCTLTKILMTDLGLSNHVFSRVRNRFITCEKLIYHA